MPPAVPAGSGPSSVAPTDAASGRESPVPDLSRRKALLFDLDGTLVDSIGDIRACVNLVRGEQGLAPLGEIDVRRAVGEGARVLTRRTLAPVIENEARLEQLYRRLLHWYEERSVVETRLYPLARDFLVVAREAGCVLALVTNKPMGITQQLLDALGLREFFADVKCPENSPHIKPDPRAISAPLATLAILPSEAAFLGDSIHDFAAARGAGVFAVGMRHGYFVPGEPEPDTWVAGFGELLTAWGQPPR